MLPRPCVPLSAVAMTNRSSVAVVLALLACGALAFPRGVAAQGCIAVRHTPAAAIIGSACGNCDTSKRQRTAMVAYRWLRSERDFSGDEEQRQFKDNDPIENDVHSVDLSLTFGITDHWSTTLTVPFVSADRTTKYEHDGVHEYGMSAGGLGDVRLVGNYWVFDPRTHIDGNLSLGLGFDAPTGRDDLTDIAHRRSRPTRRPVDTSIQPGDGGWGVIFEMQAFRRLYTDVYGYAAGSYMLTPEEQNDTEQTVDDLLEAPDVLRFNSITDQYLARLGITYVLWPEAGWSVSLGARAEGVPVHDAIGGSMGFRRPGYAISVEPGTAWSFGSNVFTLSLPAAVYRNRQRSPAEEEAGIPRGRATFADFVVLASIAHHF